MTETALGILGSLAFAGFVLTILILATIPFRVAVAASRCARWLANCGQQRGCATASSSPRPWRLHLRRTTDA